MNRFDLVAFDCDGVLVDSEPITFAVFTQALNALGWDVTLEEAMGHFVGKSFMDERELIEARIGGPLPVDFHPRYLAERDRALAEQVEPVRGVRAVLHDLIAQQRPFCVASGADRAKMEVTLGRTGLRPLFDERIFSASDVARSKPAPDVYLHAARMLHVRPERCVVIEDTPTGVQAGIAAGMTVFGYAERSDARALLRAGAWATFADMRDLPALLA